MAGNVDPDRAARTVALGDLAVLVLDCQATGSDPTRGHLLEIGWSPFQANDGIALGLAEITTHLMQLPDAAAIPRPVERLTGLTASDLHPAREPAMVWSALCSAARAVAAKASAAICPTVVHFARFEQPYLVDLHQRFGFDQPFPFDLICTHDIARRLLPGLPRKGLRAVAGYFGHSTPKHKRCEAHVSATCVIWHHLVALLDEQHGIGSLNELRTWLTRPFTLSPSGRSYPMRAGARTGLPERPGVYRMLRSSGDVLYVGKAKSLKHRVSSYFQQHRRHSENILEMLSQAADLDVTVTKTALEAAVLEAEEIKTLSPPYNIALQESGRQLWYCSKDFLQLANEPDTLHRIGPLPSKTACRAVREIGRLLAQQTFRGLPAGVSPANALDLLPEYAPSTDCLEQGVTFFRCQFDIPAENGSIWRRLIGIGHRSWLTKLEQREAAEREAATGPQQSDAREEAKEPDVPLWTPEAVAGRMESILRHCSHGLRRSRWFCLLSESSLAWNTVDAGSRRGVVLVFGKGQVVVSRSAAKDPAPPLPPGIGLPFRARQQHFDVKTYDRMRVVTTELKRLLSEGRRVRLRVGKRAILGPNEMKKGLRWL